MPKTNLRTIGQLNFSGNNNWDAQKQDSLSKTYNIYISPIHVEKIIYKQLHYLTFSGNNNWER